MITKKKKSKILDYDESELDTLKKVNYRLALLVDYKHQLKGGLYRGIGFAIGASIIGAIIVTIILNFFEGIDNPFVQDVIQNSESTTNPSSNSSTR